MALADSLEGDVAEILTAHWQARDGRVVPKTKDVVLRDGAVDIEAVVLYADLARSTQLAEHFPRKVVGKVVRAYLLAMAQIVRHHDGEIRSFDGDRIMAVFVGNSKNTDAGKCALRMNWGMSQILRPTVEAKFPSLSEKGFVLSHCVGVHRSKLRVVRGGIREHNDLIFVGSAPNIAAALSQERTPRFPSYVTAGVHGRMHKSVRISDTKGTNRWRPVEVKIKGKTWKCSWWWPP